MNLIEVNLNSFLISKSIQESSSTIKIISFTTLTLLKYDILSEVSSIYPFNILEKNRKQYSWVSLSKIKKDVAVNESSWPSE